MIFDYYWLELIWWGLIVFVLVLYGTTAGHDFGITILMPFESKHKDFSKDDVSRRTMLNTIAPTWDGNQTWLVFAGGCLFGVWSSVYATVFSGLYPALLLVLFSFFLRPPGFDFRGKLPSKGWRVFWDWSLFISAFFPVIAFGLLIGNLFEGLPFMHDPFYMQMTYYGSVWELLNVFGIISALMGLCMVLMQGGIHLNRRVDGELGVKYRNVFYIFGIGFLVFVTIALLMIAYSIKGLVPIDAMANPDSYNTPAKLVTGGWLNNYYNYPGLWAFPACVYGGVILAMIFAPKVKWLAFWCSSIAIACLLISAGLALFPYLVPSQFTSDTVTFGQQSLTVWNSSAKAYTLMGLIYICVPPIIVFAFWSKIAGMFAIWKDRPSIDASDVEKNDHVYY
ncbi:cytochrome d ubiquinol oxidase subunit II [Francisellaceae bacterium]|nr:cytochrome d ubiquinol oxidase subunit II [Francisellaceae bacterium]